MVDHHRGGGAAASSQRRGNNAGGGGRSLVVRLSIVALVVVACLAAIQFAVFHRVLNNTMLFTFNDHQEHQHSSGWAIPHSNRETTSSNNASQQQEQLVRSLKKEIADAKSEYEGFKAQLEAAKKKQQQPAKGNNEEKKTATTSTTTRAAQETSSSTTTNNNIKKKPNILLLYADDWRHDTLSAAPTSNQVIQTPHLDKLAKEGILFSHNCVTTSICGISRATLQTGQYFSRHKCNPHQRGGYPEPNFYSHWNETLNGLLKQQGYYLGFVGKWQIRGLPHDEFDVVKEYYGYHVNERTGEHITERNEKDALKFLKQRPKDKPFFLTVSFFATHAVDGDPRQYIPQNSSQSLYTQVQVPMSPSATEESWARLPKFFIQQNEGRSRWRKRYSTPEKYQHNMKNMYRMATEVDATSGRILEELSQQGVLDDTLVIFTTDNGNFHAEHGLADKWYPHQESIRVPLIIKDPRMSSNKRGTINDELTLNIDLAPTIVSAAGVTQLPKRMQGRDMSQLYLLQQDTKKEDWRKHFFYEHPVIDCEVCIPSSEALVVKDSNKYLKYFLWPGHSREQIFDLNTDPYEENDLIHSKQHKVELQSLRYLFNQTKKAAL